jgi:hypothetical protein
MRGEIAELYFESLWPYEIRIQFNAPAVIIRESG